MKGQGKWKQKGNTWHPGVTRKSVQTGQESWAQGVTSAISDLAHLSQAKLWPNFTHFILQPLLPFIPLTPSLLSLAGSFPSVPWPPSYPEQVVYEHSPFRKILEMYLWILLGGWLKFHAFMVMTWVIFLGRVHVAESTTSLQGAK